MIDEKCDYVFDMRDAMGDISETTYYDDHHVNDLGNELIAKKIYEKILPIILKDISK